MKKIIIGLSILVVLVLSSYFGLKLINKDKIKDEYLTIELIGNKDITIEYGSEYTDQGANAKYKDEDISKDIVTSDNLNLEKIGKYTYTYKITYKKVEKELKRYIKVVDTKAPELVLNGDKEITIYEGSNYEEKGAKAEDNYDKEITDKIEIEGTVDTSKIGEYTITYRVSDSSDNESSITRLVKVVAKPKPEQKVAVINYHFFYEAKTPACDEPICEKMDTFRQHLQYLNDNGFKTLTIKEFVDWIYGRIEIPEKSVLVTIDDGAFGTGKHNGNYLIPALEQYKIHATLFLITGWWNISNYQSSYLDVESHTHNLHFGGDCGRTSKVNCISYEELVKDLTKSVNITQSKEAFAFPFYESSDNAIRAIKDVGFKVAFVGGSRKASRKDDKYRIPRYEIFDATSMQSFITMVN